MKVLFLAHSFPRTADDPVGSFVLRLAVALKAHGLEVRVLAPSAEGLAASEVFEGITVERYRYAPRRFETPTAEPCAIRFDARGPPNCGSVRWLAPSGGMRPACAGGSART
jgi:hypothetical protein